MTLERRAVDPGVAVAPVAIAQLLAKLGALRLRARARRDDALSGLDDFSGGLGLLFCGGLVIDGSAAPHHDQQREPPVSHHPMLAPLG